MLYSKIEIIRHFSGKYTLIIVDVEGDRKKQKKYVPMVSSLGGWIYCPRGLESEYKTVLLTAFVNLFNADITKLTNELEKFKKSFDIK